MRHLSPYVLQNVKLNKDLIQNNLSPASQTAYFWTIFTKAQKGYLVQILSFYSSQSERRGKFIVDLQFF